MLTPRIHCVCLLVLAAMSVGGQPFGLSNRVANTTLLMPSSLPSPEYGSVNAFGNLTFFAPVAISSPPGETNRLFVLEKGGIVAVITNLAVPSRTVFLDISWRIDGGPVPEERGLLGLAFHPGYATNRYFYLFYSTISSTPGIATNATHERLSRFRASMTDPDQADYASELILLNQFDEAPNHNGGCLQFGPDGFLYISVGDEGSNNDALNNSQRIDKDFYSAIMRIDVDNLASSVPANAHPSNTNNATGKINYLIPADNPFIGATNFNGLRVNPVLVRTEFFAVGLRNPWRFSFDAATGLLYCGDVGEGAWEEVDIIVKGGNYGWAFREGPQAGPKTAVPGFSSLPPILAYAHGSGTNQGNSVIGGVVYRGNGLPELQGCYIFGDYVSGNVWASRYNGSNATPVTRLLVEPGVSAFGIDPRNGDVLMCSLAQNSIKRLVPPGGLSAPLPRTLADTGAFSDLISLTPQAGILPYDINLPFWSDNAEKRRWFYIPRAHNIIFRPTILWLFPTGSVWIKHFELELTNGVPESKHRLETRFIVRDSSAGVYGVTYRWDESQTNATLVPDAGMDEMLTIYDAGISRTQTWHYPGRAECLRCHTGAGGLALGFNTPQLNREFDYHGVLDNQIRALNHAGYFQTPATNLYSWRTLIQPTNEVWSVESRVRSYLFANCSQCHQPTGPAVGFFDARLDTPLSSAQLVNGTLFNSGGSASNRVIKPGSLSESILFTRVSTTGPGRMPPLDSTVPDTNAINLLRRWITGDLVSYQSFADWQTAWFGSTNAPLAAAAADPDDDGARNVVEWLTHTEPNNASSSWRTGVQRASNAVEIVFPRIANRGFEVQRTVNLSNPGLWEFLDVPGNEPFFAASDGLARVRDVMTNGPTRYYRVRVYEP